MIKACKDCPYVIDDDECKLDGQWAISDEQYNEQKPMWCPLEKKEQNDLYRANSRKNTVMQSY